MPRTNRVAPTGEILATPERGTLMGNRGVLHNADGRVVRPWQLTRWISCLLNFRGRHRAVMTPGRYTELFFLDEAVAFAAGHRPCAECRRSDFRAFQTAWRAAGLGDASAPAMDAVLHDDRVGLGRTKRTYEGVINDLPDGVFVVVDGAAMLVRGKCLFPWSFSGYAEPRPRPRGVTAEVLTPRSIVAAIEAGYGPGIHASGV